MTNRIRSLDLLKAVAATQICLLHYQMLYGDQPLGRLTLGGGFPYGSVVELFFFLSGFLIFRYRRRIEEGLGFRAFFLRRWLRLLPLMALSALVYALLSWGYCYDAFRLSGELRGFYPQESPSLWGLLVTMLGLQSGWGPQVAPINSPLWYLSVLLACYLLFYGGVRLCARLRLDARLFFVGMLMLGVTVSRHEWELPFLTSVMGRGYAAFFPGVLFAGALEGRTVSRRAALLGAALAACFFAGFAHPYTRALLLPGHRFLFALLICPALAALCSWDGVRRLCDRPWIEALGAISFNVYVWHMPALILTAILAEALGLRDFFASPAGMLVSVLCFWLLGAASHFWIENPLTRLTARLIKA